MIETPESDKLLLVKEKAQIIGLFLEDLYEKGFRVCYRTLFDKKEKYYVRSTTIEEMLAEYFEIDLELVEKERMSVLSKAPNAKLQ
jgi:hypothetical protein